MELTVEPDKGMSDAINKGFKSAKGKWVMWLNTDDYLLPGALAEVKTFAENKPDTDVIYGCWNFIGKEGDYQRTMNVFPIQKIMLSQFCYIASTSTFFRRETVMDDGFYLNDRFKYVMDGEYYNRLLHAGKRFVYFPKVLAEFRVHDASLSLRNTGAKTIDQNLDWQLQLSESRAIRRTYGPAFTNNEHIKCMIDGVFNFTFRVIKQILYRLNRPK